SAQCPVRGVRPAARCVPRDLADGGMALDMPLVQSFHGIAVRRDHAHTRDDDPSSGHKKRPSSGLRRSTTRFRLGGNMNRSLDLCTNQSENGETKKTVTPVTLIICPS